MHVDLNILTVLGSNSYFKKKNRMRIQNSTGFISISCRYLLKITSFLWHSVESYYLIVVLIIFTRFKLNN